MGRATCAAAIGPGQKPACGVPRLGLDETRCFVRQYEKRLVITGLLAALEAKEFLQEAALQFGGGGFLSQGLAKPMLQPGLTEKRTRGVARFGYTIGVHQDGAEGVNLNCLRRKLGVAANAQRDAFGRNRQRGLVPRGNEQGAMSGVGNV